MERQRVQRFIEPLQRRIGSRSASSPVAAAELDPVRQAAFPACGEGLRQEGETGPEESLPMQASCRYGTYGIETHHGRPASAHTPSSVPPAQCESGAPYRWALQQCQTFRMLSSNSSPLSLVPMHIAKSMSLS